MGLKKRGKHEIQLVERWRGWEELGKAGEDDKNTLYEILEELIKIFQK